MKKVSPVCEICTGWLEQVRMKSGLWWRCRSCGYMKKIVNKTIKPVGMK